MRNLITPLVVALGIASAGSVSAATFDGFTEGNRDKVVGTSASGVDADPNAPGVQLGTIAANSIFGLYGRIKQSQDIFEFDFSIGTNFSILFDFDGYDTLNTFADGVAAGSFPGSQSGLMGVVGVSDNNFSPATPEKTVVFSLSDGLNPAQTKSYIGDVNATTGTGRMIFAGGPGDYTLTIDGSQGDNSDAVSFYDLNISTVPLPAAAWMLLASIGGLGAFSRFNRRSRDA